MIGSQWATPIALGVPIGIAILFTDDGATILGGIATPNGSFVPAPLALFAYGCAFGLGWMLSRNLDLLAIWCSRWRSYLAAALLATGLCVVLVALAIDELFAEGASSVERQLFAITYAFASWCWMFAATGFALRFLSAPSTVRRYLADASYWIYLVHYPIVVVLQVALATVHWHWLVKLAIILLVTFGIALATYHLLVRFTIIGRALNGRQFPRPSATKSLASG
jgi:peptidoglycan/LPS O-acetylase OafA/YrhL